MWIWVWRIPEKGARKGEAGISGAIALLSQGPSAGRDGQVLHSKCQKTRGGNGSALEPDNQGCFDL